MLAAEDGAPFDRLVSRLPRLALAGCVQITIGDTVVLLKAIDEEEPARKQSAVNYEELLFRSAT